MESDEWIDVREVLGREPTPDDLRRLMREYEVIFNVTDGVFYIKQRKRYEGKARARNDLRNDVLRRFLSRFNGLTPKPTFLDELCSEFQNCEAIYERLLKEGLVEEVIISGMTFVKVKC